MFDDISEDFKRLSHDKEMSLRTLVAGLLSPGLQAIVVYRFFKWCKNHSIPGQPLRFFVERFIEIITGISIPVQCKIGKGLRIHHFGGIIFHPTVELGDNCTLYHEVTIGDRGGYGGAARIGNGVLIGAGAKIIGEISIGDNCLIGANAVVNKDIPANSVVFGNPCQIKQKKVVEKANSANGPIRVMDLRGTYKGGGGPDKTILNSALHHDTKKVDVLVTYIRRPDDSEFEIRKRAKALGIRYVDVCDRKFLDIICVKKLKSLIKKHNITLVHVHDDKTLLYGWLLKLITPGINIMSTCHSHSCYSKKDFMNAGDYLNYLIREKIQIFLMKRYKNPLLTISENTKKRLAQNGIPEKRQAVLYNGIDIDYWKRSKGRPVLKKELNLGVGHFLVGTVARITYDKDLPVFYEIARLVSEKVPSVTFVIVGDGFGDELARAKEQVRRLGAEKIVKFTGHRNDLLDVYASLDIFLMTSLTEGLPNTALEAMAMDVPVVSTSVGGVPELVVHGETGFLAARGDAVGLSGHLVDLLGDRMKRETFAKNSRRRIEDHFSFSERVKKMESYYEQIN